MSIMTSGRIGTSIGRYGARTAHRQAAPPGSSPKGWPARQDRNWGDSAVDDRNDLVGEVSESQYRPAVRGLAFRCRFPHLALMPDAHLGKGATVGSVAPTLGAIIPAAVGVDIGCSMIALRT
jgi:hypothetical protein